jgi:hypothetical protein
LRQPNCVVSSISPPWCHFYSDRRRHATAPFHASFPWSQDELAASTSSSDNTSSHHLPSQAEIEALNSHHRRWPPSSDRLTPILHFYKNVISTLTTLPTTQLRLCFVFSLTRAPGQRSSTRRRGSLSPSSHVHRPSTQRHPR